MTKHTQREWHKGLLQGYLWTDIVNANDHTIIKVKTHKMVGPYQSEPDPEGMANLALVKAAARLLDFAIQSELLFHELESYRNIDYKLLAEWNEARLAAIEEAQL